MKNFIKNVKQIHSYSIDLLLKDELVSFSIYFTLLFSEILYFWTFYKEKALVFTILNILYIFTIIFFAYLKYISEPTKKEEVCARLYPIVFILIFGIGCFIDRDFCIKVTVFPLLYTGFSIAINHIHYSKKLKPYIPFIDSVFLDTITFTLNRLLAVILPVFVFSFITLSTSINMALKLIIISIYIIIFPFFAFIEDITGALNIFEIAYFIMYSENLSFSIANYNGI